MSQARSFAISAKTSSLVMSDPPFKGLLARGGKGESEGSKDWKGGERRPSYIDNLHSQSDKRGSRAQEGHVREANCREQEALDRATGAR